MASSICLDVGSNNGEDSLGLSKLHPSAKVYAFEPHPKFFTITVKNTALNPNIEVLPYAVSDSSERFVTLNESSGDMSHSILPFKSSEELKKYWSGYETQLCPTGKTFKVRQTRLDNFLKSRGYEPSSLIIENMHVDAQGVDLEVLKSLGSYLRCVKMGSVEAATTADTTSYKGQKGTIDTVRAFLEENGFVITELRPWDTSSALPCEQDIYFIRKEEE